MIPFLNSNKISKSKIINAFTLVEVMVVVLIIVIIATLAMVSYTSIRVKSRDIKRVTSINTLQTALNGYYKDHGVFPAIITPGMPLRNSSNTKTYLDEVPFNPQPQTDHNCSNLEYIYKVSADKQAYSLSACIGADNNPNKNKLIYGTKEGVFHCGDRITDRDGFTYGTVTIGSQCWMSENLRTKTKPDGSCINHDQGIAPPNCTWLYNGVEYGSYSVLDSRDCITTSNSQGTESDCQAGRTVYKVHEALQCTWDITGRCNWTGPSCISNSNCSSGQTCQFGCQPTSLPDVMCCNNTWVSNQNVRGICPEGWHVPSEKEFSTLEQYLSAPAVCDPNRVDLYQCAGAEIKLKTTGSSGFNAGLVGRRNATTDAPGSTLPPPFPGASKFMSAGVADWFITANINQVPNTAYLRIIDSSSGINRKSLNISTGRGFSLRCIKD